MFKMGHALLGRQHREEKREVDEGYCSFDIQQYNQSYRQNDQLQQYGETLRGEE